MNRVLCCLRGQCRNERIHGMACRLDPAYCTSLPSGKHGRCCDVLLGGFWWCVLRCLRIRTHARTRCSCVVCYICSLCCLLCFAYKTDLGGNTRRRIANTLEGQRREVVDQRDRGFRFRQSGKFQLRHHFLFVVSALGRTHSQGGEQPFGLVAVDAWCLLLLL